MIYFLVVLFIFGVFLIGMLFGYFLSERSHTAFPFRFLPPLPSTRVPGGRGVVNPADVPMKLPIIDEGDSFFGCTDSDISELSVWLSDMRR